MINKFWRKHHTTIGCVGFFVGMLPAFAFVSGLNNGNWVMVFSSMAVSALGFALMAYMPD